MSSGCQMTSPRLDDGEPGRHGRFGHVPPLPRRKAASVGAPALTAAAALIVLCSPHPSPSRWPTPPHPPRALYTWVCVLGVHTPSLPPPSPPSYPHHPQPTPSHPHHQQHPAKGAERSRKPKAKARTSYLVADTVIPFPGNGFDRSRRRWTRGPGSARAGGAPQAGLGDT